MPTIKEWLFAIIIIVAIFLAMLPTPTPTPTPDYSRPLVFKGSVTVPSGMTVNGTYVQIYNQTDALVGEGVVNQTGMFRIVTSSYRGGTYSIEASKGYAQSRLTATVTEDYNNFGDADIGVLALERI